jgi:outer membrane lipoprotein-sorting protein
MAIFSLFCAGNIQAQSSHNEAKKMLAKASEKLNSFKNIFLKFTYTFENTKVQPPVSQSENGDIAIQGDDFHLNFLGTKQIKVKNKLYTILDEDEEVQITEYEEDETQGISPSKILKNYQKGYSYKVEKTVKKDGKSWVHIKLKPNASEEINQILIVLEKVSLRVKTLKQWGTNGSITTFNIDDYVPNKKLPNSYFTFDKKNYPDYYIAE